jgi:hypothetical protein
MCLKNIHFFLNSSKLFQSEGWNENIAHELTRYIVNKLDNNEKEMLAKDISLDEISKVIKILKPYQSEVKEISP